MHIIVLGICHCEWFWSFCPTVNEIVSLALYTAFWLDASISTMAFFLLLLKSISFCDCYEEHLKALISCKAFFLLSMLCGHRRVIPAANVLHPYTVFGNWLLLNLSVGTFNRKTFYTEVVMKSDMSTLSEYLMCIKVRLEVYLDLCNKYTHMEISLNCNLANNQARIAQHSPIYSMWALFFAFFPP